MVFTITEPRGSQADVPASVVGMRTIEVSGELDLVNASQIEHLLLDALQTGDIHLDLRSVTFADSTALTALVSAKQAANERERRFHITAAGSVRRLIEVTGLANHLLS